MKSTQEELVSVIMPNYNEVRFVRQAVDSVLRQTYANLELLIADDCSTDGSVAVIREAAEKDSRIRLFVLEEQKNAAVARNTALRHAKGKYIAFLDADDYWDERKLEKQIRYMRENRIPFCCHSYGQVNADGKPDGYVYTPPEKISYDTCLRLSNPIGNLTAVYDREALGTVFAPDIRCRNDFAMWLRILKKTEFCYGMKDVLAWHRAGLSSSVSGKKLRLIRYHWQLYRDVEKLGIVKSIYCMLCWAVYKGLYLNRRKNKTDHGALQNGRKTCETE